jgi:hypothetical protein
MVAMTVDRSPRVRDPAPSWLRAGIVAMAIVASLVGWAVAARADAAWTEAQRAAAVANAEAHDADLSDARAERIESQRDGLASLVRYRCDTGAITDRQLCDAARSWR